MPDTLKPDAKAALIAAARLVLMRDGFAGLSTRSVAEAAGTQMSQIRYHFGSKEGLILAMFEAMNAELLERQAALFAEPGLSVADRWDRACDYLEEDLASGYVRVIQELMAAGWTQPAIRAAVADGLMGWHRALLTLAREAEAALGDFAPFAPRDVACLVASAFLGAEAQILLGIDDDERPVKRALRRVGAAIRMAEEGED